MPDLAPLWLTLQLAVLTTLCLVLVGTPLAWWLARTRSPLRPFVEVLTALPLVLPPSVLGFYLLIAFAPDSALGHMLTMLGGIQLAFSFEGLVVASTIYSLPFMVQPLSAAFGALPAYTLDNARNLGASAWDRFFRVALPQAAPGFRRAAILSFAHTIGEFGVVLMIGGNIPGETQVLSIALYEQVEALNYDTAHLWAGLLLLLSVALLLPVYWRRGGETLIAGRR